jgi:hypothetical protein
MYTLHCLLHTINQPVNIDFNLCVQMSILLFILLYILPLFVCWSSTNHSHLMYVHLSNSPPPPPPPPPPHLASVEIPLSMCTHFIYQICCESDENMCKKCCKLQDHLEMLINKPNFSQLIIKILQE